MQTILAWIWIWFMMSLVIIVIVLLFMFYYYFLKSLIVSKWVPYVPSFNSDLKIMKDNLNLKKWTTLLDLWCGDWKALRVFVKHFHLSKWVWYDINKFAILYWKTINRFLKVTNVFLHKENMKNVDISKYDYIYLYLFPEFMKSIEDRIFNSIWPKTIIISNSFKFWEKQPFKIIGDKKWKSKIYLYRNEG